MTLVTPNQFADNDLASVVKFEAYLSCSFPMETFWIVAFLTRFGTFDVVILDPLYRGIWKGDNILQARDHLLAENGKVKAFIAMEFQRKKQELLQRLAS